MPSSQMRVQRVGPDLAAERVGQTRDRRRRSTPPRCSVHRREAARAPRGADTSTPASSAPRSTPTVSVGTATHPDAAASNPHLPEVTSHDSTRPTPGCHHPQWVNPVYRNVPSLISTPPPRTHLPPTRTLRVQIASFWSGSARCANSATKACSSFAAAAASLSRATRHKQHRRRSRQRPRQTRPPPRLPTPTSSTSSPTSPDPRVSERLAARQQFPNRRGGVTAAARGGARRRGAPGAHLEPDRNRSAARRRRREDAEAPWAPAEDGSPRRRDERELRGGFGERLGERGMHEQRVDDVAHLELVRDRDRDHARSARPRCARRSRRRARRRSRGRRGSSRSRASRR